MPKNSKSRRLMCLIEGESCFAVTVKRDCFVNELKKAIQSTRAMSVLKGIDPATLKMWKVNINLTSLDEDFLPHLKLENIEGVEKLRTWDPIMEHWPNQPPTMHLHVIVKVPPTDTISPSSSEGTITAKPVSVSTTYTSRWLALKNASWFYTVDTMGHLVPSAVPSKGSVLCLEDSSKGFSILDRTTISSIYIRECYLTWFNFFLDEVAKDPNGKFALSSTPGCGKTFATNFIFKLASMTPLLEKKEILYQFKSSFYLYQSDKVTKIKKNMAEQKAIDKETFYILDGCDADAVTAECLTLFISSPRSNTFKDWYVHAMITPKYFPVWSLEELQSCRELCYPTLDAKTVDDRYQQYGGVARYVFFQAGKPPCIESAISDADARRSIRSVGSPSILHPNSHMLLHIVVDEYLEYDYITLASRHIGILLFTKYFEEMLDNLQDMLGGGGALAGHLFECYCHFVFQQGYFLRHKPLHCRSLEGGAGFQLRFRECKVENFRQLPNSLSSGIYYVPLATNFAAVDALTTEVGLQFTVAQDHPIKGIRVVNDLVNLHGGELRLVFVVPETIAANFQKQKIVTTNGRAPAQDPPVKQYVVGLRLGIDTPIFDSDVRATKRRRVLSL
ncbi:hypothetical protein JOM56_009005 [Amanita muscaria]